VDYFSFENNIHGSKIADVKEIKMITYNIKAVYEKEKDQIDNLMDYINNERFDIVMFQELFNERTRDYILDKTDTNLFSTIIARVDYNSIPEVLFQDAGLFVMARYPRIDLTDIEFGDGIKNSNGVVHMILVKEISHTNDFFANKSVLGILFKIDEKTKLFLFTTHVQAIGTIEIKEAQLVQIKNFIDVVVNKVMNSGIITSSKDLIVLLAGDFNSNAYDKERSAKMQKLLGYPRDLHKEFHGDKEEYTFRFSSRNASRRFDYIMAYDSIGQYPLKKIIVTSINAIDITDNEKASISDHLGLKANLNIK
jgi:endonuclease/exonuclease/phosphatase family metal-dependent hydrolase